MTIRTFSRNDNLIETRRAQIAISAAALVAKQGWASLNVREVAKACNIGMGTCTLHRDQGRHLNLIIGYGLSRYQDFFRKNHRRPAHHEAPGIVKVCH